jgi:hypothetical protein
MRGNVKRNHMTGAPATPADENRREEYDHGWWKRAAGNISGAHFVPQEKLARLT